MVVNRESTNRLVIFHISINVQKKSVHDGKLYIAILKFKSNIFLKNFKLSTSKQSLKYLSHISVINTFALYMSGTSENALLLTLYRLFLLKSKFLDDLLKLAHVRNIS